MIAEDVRAAASVAALPALPDLRSFLAIYAAPQSGFSELDDQVLTWCRMLIDEVEALREECAPAKGIRAFSEREAEVAEYLLSNLTCTEIGRQLFISENTVKTHVKGIYHKLGVHNRLAARRMLLGARRAASPYYETISSTPPSEPV